MSELSFYVAVLKALEEIQAQYALVGAFAGLSFGMARTTFDMDLLVDLNESQIQALAGRFPLPRYYADPEMIRNSIRMGILFNIIDTEEGVKADFVPIKGDPELRSVLEHRIKRPFIDEDGNIFEAWCASPEDIIIGKLGAWTEGQSMKHPADILNILVFMLSSENNIPFDTEHVTRASEELGARTLKLWHELLQRAKQELRKYHRHE